MIYCARCTLRPTFKPIFGGMIGDEHPSIQLFLWYFHSMPIIEVEWHGMTKIWKTIFPYISMIYVRCCPISPLHLGMKKRLHQVPLYVPVMSRDTRLMQSLYIGCPLTTVLLPVCSMIIGHVVGKIYMVLIFPLQSHHLILTTCSNNSNNTPLVPISSNTFPW